jgi:4-amino-4-deoxy-L-arabinose transferase-like glycosyltransferase
MVVDGEWAVPHVNGVITTDKPPLFFWLIALVSLPWGEVTSVTARLPSALAALGTLWLTMRLGRRFYGPRTAALAGALLATSYMFWDKARSSQIDSLLCLLIWVALSAFEAFRAGDAQGRRAALVFWLAIALAVLAKGPVGLLLPLGVALVTLAWDRLLGRWRDFGPLVGPLAFLAVAGAWMVWSSVGTGGEYSVWGALQEHFVNRGLHGMHHKQPPWYYLEVLPIHLMPWSGLLPGALVLAWRRRRRPAERFLWVASLFVVLFFTVSTEKRDLYILPAYPAFALLMAGLVAAVCRWGEGAEEGEEQTEAPASPDRRWITVGEGIVGGVLTLASVALAVAGDRFEPLPYWMALALGAILFASGVLAVHLALRGRPLRVLLTLGGGTAAAYLFLVTAVYPALEPIRSARPFALTIKEATAKSRAAGLPVVAYALGNLPEPFAFYSNGVYTQETNDPAVLERHLERPEAVFAAVNGDELDPLPRELRERLWVVASTRLSRRDVLLVTNREVPGARPLVAGVEGPPPGST